MARAPLQLQLRKNQLHKDLGKAPGAKITEADITKEKSQGGVFARRAQFAENAKNWRHPGKGKRKRIPSASADASSPTPT